MTEPLERRLSRGSEHVSYGLPRDSRSPRGVHGSAEHALCGAPYLQCRANLPDGVGDAGRQLDNHARKFRHG